VSSLINFADSSFLSPLGNGVEACTGLPASVAGMLRLLPLRPGNQGDQLSGKTWKCQGIFRMSGKSPEKWEKSGKNTVGENYCCKSVAMPGCTTILILVALPM